MYTKLYHCQNRDREIDEIFGIFENAIFNSQSFAILEIDEIFGRNWQIKQNSSIIQT